MKKERGSVAVIEGIDGSGKTKQTSLLLDRLNKEGYQTATLDFPQYEKNFFGELCGVYLRGECGDAVELSPYLASLPYALDRWESSPLLWQWIREGKVVVMNRYTTANIGHQGSKIADREKRWAFFKWLEKMEYDIFKIPRPDIVALLKINPDITADLIGRKGKRTYLSTPKDMHEANIKHQRDTLECFLEAAQANPDIWRVIDCEDGQGEILPAEVISEKIWQAVEPALTG